MISVDYFRAGCMEESVATLRFNFSLKLFRAPCLVASGGAACWLKRDVSIQGPGQKVTSFTSSTSQTNANAAQGRHMDGDRDGIVL